MFRTVLFAAMFCLAAAAMNDLIAGNVTMSFDTTASSIGQIRGGDAML